LFCGSSLPIKTGGLVLAGHRLARAVRAFRPDLIHLHTEIPEAAFAVTSVLSPAAAGTRIIRTVHNSVYWESWPRLGRWSDRRTTRAFVAGVSHDAVAAFQRLRAASGAEPPPAAPAVIFNGVSVSGSPRPFGQPPGKPLRVLFAGRLEPQKGADLLPEILSATPLGAERTGELCIFGDGSQVPVLRRLAAHPPRGWTVHVRPPTPDLVQRMAEFDLVIMPSRFEGLSLVAIEALLLAVPLVATDAPGLREQLPPAHPWRARAGDAADFARVLQCAITETARWPDAVTRGREFALSRFCPPGMLMAYAELYRQVLAANQ
jgi:glycosyltransferase involved in cell wall biosynthesis